MEKCRPLKLKMPGILLSTAVKRSNASRKDRGCKGGEGRKWAGRAPAKYRQRLFFEKYLCGRFITTHTRKKKKNWEKIISYTSATISLKYQRYRKNDGSSWRISVNEQ